MIEILGTALDYSAGYPRAKEIKKKAQGVIRYLPKEPYQGKTSSVKVLTRSELLSLQEEDLGVSFVYEHIKPNRARDGSAAGVNDGMWALQKIADLDIDVNNNYTVYFAVDYDAPVGDYAAIFNYFKSIQVAFNIKRIGAYAKWDLLRLLFDKNLITYGWQTYAWSSGHNKDLKTLESRAHLFQNIGTLTVDGVGCDTNLILKNNWGQLRVTESPIPPKDEDMQLTDIIGKDANGQDVTVAQALLKSYNTPSLPVGQITELLHSIKTEIDNLPDDIRISALNTYTKISGLIRTINGQATWGDLTTWEALKGNKWGNLKLTS